MLHEKYLRAVEKSLFEIYRCICPCVNFSLLYTLKLSGSYCFPYNRTGVKKDLFVVWKRPCDFHKCLLRCQLKCALLPNYVFVIRLLLLFQRHECEICFRTAWKSAVIFQKFLMFCQCQFVVVSKSINCFQHNLIERNEMRAMPDFVLHSVTDVTATEIHTMIDILSPIIIMLEIPYIGNILQWLSLQIHGRIL